MPRKFLAKVVLTAKQKEQFAKHAKIRKFAQKRSNKKDRWFLGLEKMTQIAGK